MFVEHDKYMLLAIKEAIKAGRKGEVPVGAILIDENKKIIAKAYNQTIIDSDPTAHAEIRVLRRAASKLKNYRLLDKILYVTMEPCMMCMGAIIHARIATLVFGSFDKKWGAAGSLYDLTSDERLNHRIKAIGGVNAKACNSLVQKFFQTKRNRFL